MKKRENGQEQPYISLGLFKLRLPFLHYGYAFPEAIQGLILVAVALGAIPILQETLGLPFELAISVVILNGLLYLLHPIFGDPVFPGWITPALPLVLAYSLGFQEGPDRIQAIIALQLTMALVFLLMGGTGLAKKLVAIVPVSLRSGIILGADIVSGVVATGFDLKKNKSLFIDIGTNGEIVANWDGELVATSTAAGPCLEGMNISCGMRAEDGAMDAFWFDEKGQMR